MVSYKKVSVFFATVVACSVIAPFSWAGSVTNATITSLTPTRYGPANGPSPYFVFINQNDANIGCNSGSLGGFAVDASTFAGRAMIASLLTAQATGQTINVYGTGNCDVWGYLESASTVTVN